MILGASLLLSGCQEVGAMRQMQPGHPDLACGACHQGKATDRNILGVPEQTCTSSRCHTDGGPAEVTLGSVTFTHRDHADTAFVKLDCAGCHTHDQRNPALVASSDACAFCHAQALEGERAADCRTCHSTPTHVATTSQGVTIPHQDIPWVETGCVRCHYDVTEPPLEVHLTQCETCHADLEAVTREGVGRDLHPAHLTVACTSCHQKSPHRIVEMSSAVDLACGDCHAEAHVLELHPTEEWSDWSTCSTCHGDTHQAEQAMLLGFEEGVPPLPSFKFVSGMTCRTCHTEDGPSDGSQADTQTAGGDPSDCQACHPRPYNVIPGWWAEGARQRVAAASRYLDAVERAGSGSSEVQSQVAEGRRLLEMVRAGGVAHNVEFTDLLVRRAVTQGQVAAEAENLRIPSPPDFGSRARPGFCSHCHFRLNEPWISLDMPGDFHRDVVARREARTRAGGGGGR